VPLIYVAVGLLRRWGEGENECVRDYFAVREWDGMGVDRVPGVVALVIPREASENYHVLWHIPKSYVIYLFYTIAIHLTQASPPLSCFS
jgi:hypothetical protein